MPRSSTLPVRATALLLFWGLASLIPGVEIVPQVQAATFTVTRFDDPPPGSCAQGDCSLREAIIAANGSPGSTIVLSAGTYTLTIPGADNAITNEAIGDLDIRVATSIVGVGANITIVQAGTTPFMGIHRVFDNHSLENVYIANMTIRNGNDVEAGSGGCIRNGGVLTLEAVIVTGCESHVGAGGIASYHRLTVLHSTITGNRATSSTGGHVNGGSIAGGPHPTLPDSTVNIFNSVISNNTASSAGNVDLAALGGGFANTATMNVSNSIIAGNTALNCGGGISTGTMTIANSTISDNKARFDVGGVDNDGIMSISNSTFSGNVAGFGCVGAECDRLRGRCTQHGRGHDVSEQQHVQW